MPKYMTMYEQHGCSRFVSSTESLVSLPKPSCASYLQNETASSVRAHVKERAETLFSYSLGVAALYIVSP